MAFVHCLSPRKLLCWSFLSCLLFICAYPREVSATTDLDIYHGSGSSLFMRRSDEPPPSGGGDPKPKEGSPEEMNPDDVMIDPLTPAGKVKFLFPNTFLRPDEMTIFPTNQVMTIKWEYIDVAIMPRIITIQINSPGVPSKLKGSSIKTPDDRWFPVALNVSGNRDQYQWLVNVTDRAGYQLRLFDSEIGPVYYGKPGRLGLTISSKFNLFIEGRDPSYLEFFDNAGGKFSAFNLMLTTSGVVAVFFLTLGSLFVYGHWL